MTAFALALGGGVVLALAYLAVARQRRPRAERRFHATALVAVALVYVGFALAGNPGWLDLELAGVALFGALAWAGGARDPIWLAAGWAGHVVWDLLLHGGADAAFVPAAYPALCVGFDLVIALYLLSQRRRLAI